MTSSPSTEPELGLVPRLALAALAAVLYFVGYIGFDQFYLIWFCFVPVLFAVRGLSGRKTLLVGVVFGTITNMGGFYWVIHLIQEFTTLSLPLATLGYVLLCVYQGGLCALNIWVVRRAEDRLGLAPVWVLPVVVPAVELVYPLLFPSFIGYSQYQFLPIIQIVELFGMPGLSAIIMLVNGGLYELLLARKTGRAPVRIRLAVPAAAFVLTLVYGLVRLPMVEAKQADADKLHVALIQTNLGARDKKLRAEEFLARHLEMSKAVARDHKDLDLIVWPESAYNRLIYRNRMDLAEIVGPELGVPVVFGAITGDIGDDPKTGRRAVIRMFNTVLLVGADGQRRGLFDKMELLAFGETIPFADTFPFILDLLPFGSMFTRGTIYEHLTLESGVTLLPMICYEDIIPALPRRIWDRAGPAHALVNVTNDSWYGDSHEPLMHLAMAAFRSIETRRALIRSTNTGISAFVDLTGRISARTGQWTQESLVREVPIISDKSRTLYLVIGDVLAYLFWGLILAGFVRARRRR